MHSFYLYCFFLLFNSVGVRFLRLFIRLFKIILLRVLSVGAVQLHSIFSISSMLLVDL